MPCYLYDVETLHVPFKCDGKHGAFIYLGFQNHMQWNRKVYCSPTSSKDLDIWFNIYREKFALFTLFFIAEKKFLRDNVTEKSI